MPWVWHTPRRFSTFSPSSRPVGMSARWTPAWRPMGNSRPSPRWTPCGCLAPSRTTTSKAMLSRLPLSNWQTPSRRQARKHWMQCGTRVSQCVWCACQLEISGSTLLRLFKYRSSGSSPPTSTTSHADRQLSVEEEVVREMGLELPLRVYIKVRHVLKKALGDIGALTMAD
mmetsp:Transcript_22276/g.54834  ORF Transcript_22276/g.54834 Transcript_22276/m.54834 type:complete len:171 (+) Transcript_22276:1040-1552(+)